MRKTIHMRNWFALVIGLGAVAITGVAITGVAIGGHNRGRPASARNVVGLSIAKTYGTLAELRHDADVVALVSVEGASSPSTRLANVPTVDVQLRVERVLAGASQVGDTITLVQIGDPTGRISVAESLPPILRAGKRYVVYLNRQYPDQPQMFLTGLAGVFEAAANGGFHRLGDTSPDLPKSASLDQF